MRLLSEQRLVHLRRVAEGAGGGAEQLAQALRAPVLVERVPELVEQDLEVGPHVGLERGQHLVELDRHGCLAGREDVPVAGLRRVRAAGLQVDEQVALEKQAGAELHRRVGVQRQRRLLELHRHDRRGRRHFLLGNVLGADLGGLGRVLRRKVLDRRDLADVHARDPHRRRRPDVARVREHRLDRVLVRPRQRLGEGIDGQGADDHDEDQADRPVREALASFGPHGWRFSTRVSTNSRSPSAFQNSVVGPIDPGRSRVNSDGLSAGWPGNRTAGLAPSG